MGNKESRRLHLFLCPSKETELSFKQKTTHKEDERCVFTSSLFSSCIYLLVSTKLNRMFIYFF